MAQLSPPPSPAAKPVSRGSIAIVLLVLFLDLLGFGIVLPLLPYVAADFAPPEWMMSASDALGLSREGADGTVNNAIIVGALSFAFSFFQFLVAPMWGRISDFTGRKPVLAISMFGYTGAWALFAFSPSLTWLLISRAIAGVFAANIATAMAYAADVYPPEQRSKGMGLVGAAIGLGFTLGPAMGVGIVALGDWLARDVILGGAESAGALGPHTWLGLKLPIFVAMALSFSAAMLAVFRLPESLPKEYRGKRRTTRQGRFAQLAQACRQPVLGPLLLSYFLITSGFAVLETMFSEFNRSVLAFSAVESGAVFTVIGVTLVIVQGGLIGRLTKRFSAWTLVIAGPLIEGVTLLLFGLVTSMPPLIMLSIMLAFGNAIYHPSILSLVSRTASAGDQGGVMGLTSSGASLGRIAGPILGGITWGYSGSGAVTFAVGGAVVLLALPFLVFARRRGKAVIGAMPLSV